MKSVLISTQPKWVELIASGKKTIEVRKTRPTIETPFKCYIYKSFGKRKDSFAREVQAYFNCGKVIGEFVCNKIDSLYIPLSKNATPPDKEAVERATCLSFSEMQEYAGNKMFLDGWHISDLVIYDKPKELSEFSNITRPPQSWCYVDDWRKKEK